MRRRAVFRLALASLAMLAACASNDDAPYTGPLGGGGASVDAAGAGGSGAGGAGGSAGAGAGGGPGATCPVAKPALGDACAAEGATCGYGDDPDYCARFAVLCTNGAWVAWQACPRSPAPEPHCPPAAPTDGTACIDRSAWDCAYAAGARCACFACGPTGADGGPCTLPLVWHCASPAPANGCPAVFPNLGEPCDDPHAICPFLPSWGCGFAEVACDGHAWTAAPLAGFWICE